MSFDLAHPALAGALAARGYAEPTPVQDAVLQAAAGRDLLVSAETGSGKTVAYGMALAGNLLGAAQRLSSPAAPLALVVAPTRELAMQVQGELAWLYGAAGGRIASCIGGMDGRGEARALAAGCHIVVGTPGRLCDHLRRGALDLSALGAVVLDEADEMLDLGFREELEQLLSAAPEGRRTLMFSATIPRDIAALARQFQRDALRIDTLGRNRPHADIAYRAVRVAPHETLHAVINVLRQEEAPRALVFCATREGVRRLHASLLERGFASVALSGELSQAERSHALQALRDGQARVCVATDVAARGLDLPALDLVIHADLPNDRDALLHRSGRTGRAGRKGSSVLVVPVNRRRRAEELLSTAGVQAVWGEVPDADSIRARDADRLLADPMFAQPPGEEELPLIRRLLEGHTPEQVAAALIRLQRTRMPAPEEVSPVGAPERRVYGADAGAHAWFSLSLGRRHRADPKWLVPLICRMGGVEKRDIGAIRIFDRETKFEIDAARATHFAALVAEDALVATGSENPRIVPCAPAAAATPWRHPSRAPESRGRGRARAA
jgi:ATP-dependent RNA helicase DeaD